LAGFDYAWPGAYFVTICTAHRRCVLASIEEDAIHLTVLGSIVRSCWDEIPVHFAGVRLDAFVIMPNHLHGILMLSGDRRGTACRAPTRGQSEGFGRPSPASLPTIIRSFKSAVSRSARLALGERNLWQRGYFEHVIRGDEDLQEVRRYVEANPAQWAADNNNPKS
jgi:REP element-mobilizing transposase RayT